MNVIGVDPSLSATAVCIGDGKTHELRVFKSAPQGRDVKRRFERYSALVADIMDYIEPTDPACICLEGYSHGSNQGSAHLLFEFGSILRFHLTDICPKVFEVAPTSLKKFVTGKGNCADKSVVAAHCVQRWGVMLDSNDAYDGFSLYRLALCCGGVVDTENNHQQEVVRTVLLGPDYRAAEKSEKKMRRLLAGESPMKPPF